MIAQFPQFSKLGIHHKDEVVALTSHFEPYSDFNFTSLFCWNTDGSTELSILNGNLVIKLPDYLNGESIYSILGQNELDASIAELLKLTNTLKLVPEAVISNLEFPSLYKIQEDPDNYDYVYDLTHLAHLAGNKYKKKRNKARRVAKAYERSLVVKHSGTLTPLRAEALKKLFDEWAKESDKSYDEVYMENTAVNKLLDRMLDNSQSLDLISVELWIGDDLKAFSLNERINAEYAICHFEKALQIHTDIYTLLASEVAKILLHYDCKYVNWEQDMGLEGLRESKSSFHPIKMLKKYTLSA